MDKVKSSHFASVALKICVAFLLALVYCLSPKTYFFGIKLSAILFCGATLQFFLALSVTEEKKFINYILTVFGLAESVYFFPIGLLIHYHGLAAQFRYYNQKQNRKGNKEKDA